MDATKLIEGIIHNLIEKKSIKKFNNKLKTTNLFNIINLKKFLETSVILSTTLMLVGLITSFYLFEKNTALIFLITIISFLAPFFILYIIIDLVFEFNKRKKEELLPDLLLEASLYCDENSTEELIKKISESEFELISEEFKQALIEIKNGASIEEALTKIKKNNSSKSYSRVIDLFLQGYQSGSPLSQTLKETAEDLLESKAIIKERQAVMIVTKYTLLLSAGIIVPSILGSISGLVSGLNFSSIGEIGLGLSKEMRNEIFLAATIGTQIYIIEYALLSAYSLSIQENNKKKFWIYLVTLTPLAVIVFFITKSM